jgi:hypothetical protein
MTGVTVVGDSGCWQWLLAVVGNSGDTGDSYSGDRDDSGDSGGSADSGSSSDSGSIQYFLASLRTLLCDTVAFKLFPHFQYKLSIRLRFRLVLSSGFMFTAQNP